MMADVTWTGRRRARHRGRRWRAAVAAAAALGAVISGEAPVLAADSPDGPVATTTSVTIAPASVALGQTITVRATVSTGGAAVPVGYVAFDAAATVAQLWGADSYVDPFPDASDVVLSEVAVNSGGVAELQVTVSEELADFITPGGTFVIGADYRPYELDGLGIYDREYQGSTSAAVSASVSGGPVPAEPSIAINGVTIRESVVERFITQESVVRLRWFDGGDAGNLRIDFHDVVLTVPIAGTAGSVSPEVLVGTSRGRVNITTTFTPTASPQTPILTEHYLDLLGVPGIVASSVLTDAGARTVKVSATVQSGEGVAPGRLTFTPSWSGADAVTVATREAKATAYLTYPASATGRVSVVASYVPDAHVAADAVVAMAQVRAATAVAVPVVLRTAPIHPPILGPTSFAALPPVPEIGTVPFAMYVPPSGDSLALTLDVFLPGSAVLDGLMELYRASVTRTFARATTATVRCTATDRGYSCPIGLVRAGTSVRLSGIFPVPASAAGKRLVVPARISGTDPTTGAVRVLASKSTTVKVPRRTVLSVGLGTTASVGGVRAVRRGARVTLRVAVRNVGVVAATKVRVCVSVSRGAKVIRARGATTRGRKACWTVSRMKKGATATRTLAIRAPQKKGKVSVVTVVRPKSSQASSLKLAGTLPVK